MNQNIQVQLSGIEIETGQQWLTLEQEYKPSESDYVSPAVVNQMLARAVSGKSAVTYINDSCGYVKVLDGVVYVDLAFYVWPSSLDMDYSLSTNLGTISEGEYVEIYKSQDVVFNGSNSTQLEYLFSGDYEFQMPVFLSNGTPTINYELIQGDSYFQFNRDVYTVLRADGIAKGFRHVISMEFKKAEYLASLKYKISGWVTAGLTYDKVTYPPILNSGVTEGTLRIDFSSKLSGRVTFNGKFLGNINPAIDFISDIITIKAAGWKSITNGSYLEFKIKDISDEETPIREEFNISGLQNEIVATWNANGDILSGIMSLNIPPCVEELLTMCWEGDKTPSWIINLNSDKEEEFLNVYYSTCTGEVIATHWETK